MVLEGWESVSVSRHFSNITVVKKSEKTIKQIKKIKKRPTSVIVQSFDDCANTKKSIFYICLNSF